MAHILSVGRPYDPSRRSWPEGPDYLIRGDDHELRIFLRQPDRHEAEAVRRGRAEFALHLDPPHLVTLCYRFTGPSGRGLPWSDAPFSWPRQAAGLGSLGRGPEAVLPTPPGALGSESRAALLVVLVEADGGIVRAIRQISYSPEFTRALHAAIHAQAAAPGWDPARYDLAVTSLYRRYPTSEALVRAAVVRCEGGS